MVSPQNKLLWFKDKVESATVFNENFARLIGIELYDHIQSEKILRDEFESRLNYLNNLAGDENFGRLQDNLFSATQELLKLVSLEETEERQARWDGGRNRMGNYLKNVNIFAEKEEDEKVWLSLPELYLALQDKNNYYRLGDRSGRHSKQEISKTISVMSVKDQYEVNVERFFELVIYNKYRGDERGQEHLDNLLKEYNKHWYQLDELMYKKPIRLHTQQFEDFFRDCTEFHPREGHEFFYNFFKYSQDRRNEKRFNEVKNNALIVLDDLIELVEAQTGGATTNKKSVLIRLYLNKVGDLWRESKERGCYSMDVNSDRHKIVRYLVENSDYQQTARLSQELEGKSLQSIRKEIREINDNFSGRLGIKNAKLIEGKKGSGYRISPKYKVVVVNS